MDVTLDVVEPMGMETLVHFRLGPTSVCARVDPQAAGAPGEAMRLAVQMDRMHLIDPATDRVL
ncbi:MAG: TOBE domain-containing protein, partial [Elioraea sp.]|nr:TOBE domain-containing protein [Elioraea sp.]